MSKEKSAADKLREELLVQNKHMAKVVSDDEINKAFEFSKGYMSFMKKAKTEREAVKEIEKMAYEKGFEPFVPDKKYKPGDKVIYNNRGKAVILAVIGKKSIKDGVRISAAHIDSPRIDLKPNPLYEDSELALFKTHYYGGIKKYQWTAIPLSLHGVVIKANGEKVEITIGEAEGEPKFVITDLLPHLGQAQSQKKLGEAIKGEDLNIVVGSLPLKDAEGGDAVKLNIMKILNEKYGITEVDFRRAELEIVPAFDPSDIGFDRSMIGAYGHDDRVCAYPALMAILDSKEPEHTIMTVLTDKEETGSDGNTGLNSAYLKYFIYDLAAMEGVPGYRVLSKSECLSADVNAGFDPTYPEVMERNNSAYLNRGVVLTKYTGSRGKGGTSDASAEFMGKVISLFERAGIPWQTGELGKVDEGGGGTVAKYVANLDIDVVDVGVPVLSMHSPYEIVSKLDLYAAYRAFYEFFKD